MIRKLLAIILLLPSLAFSQDYEANVKALSPTGWWKGYYGNARYSGASASLYYNIQTIGDFSGNGRTFTQTTVGLEASPTRSDNRENWVTYSNSFDAWINVNTTVTANAIANPVSGHVDADRLAATANNATRYTALPSYPELYKAGTWEFSVYAKSDTAAYAQIKNSDGTTNKYTNLKFSDGTCTTTVGSTCSVTTLSDGWYRVKQTWVMAAPAATSGTIQVCPNAGTGDNCATSNGVAAYFYGAQVRNALLSDDAFVESVLGTPRLRGVSGTGALHFDGVNDSYSSTAILSDVITAAAADVYLVIRSNSASGDHMIFRDSGSQFYLLFRDATPAIIFANTDAGGADTLSIPAALGTTNIIRAWHDGGNIGASLNNVPVTPIASGNTANLAGTLAMGGSAGTGWLSADVVELIVFNSKLSAANAQTVYDYLTWVLNNPWKRVEVTP